MSISDEKGFERDERYERQAIAYSKLDEDRFRATRGILARLDEVVPNETERKEAQQCPR